MKNLILILCVYSINVVAADFEFIPVQTADQAASLATGYIQGVFREDDLRLKKNIKKYPGQFWLRYSVVSNGKTKTGYDVVVQREFPTPGCGYTVHVRSSGEVVFNLKTDVECGE